jgi:hypothetical protein
MTLTGRPIEIRYRDHLSDTAGNPAHAATFIRSRLIVIDRELRSDPREHGRILIHELFHFVWVRTGNETRLAWEALLRSEYQAKARGEAGWSAEWRKSELTPADIVRRSRKWREYCCESFCDTAAYLETGCRTETTLAQKRLALRRLWFAEQLGDPLPI